MSLDRVQWEHINRVLVECNGNVSEAARALGIHRRSLQRKLSRVHPTSSRYRGRRPLRQFAAPGAAPLTCDLDTVRMAIVRLLAVLAVFAATGGIASAQENLNLASLRGRVVDATGAAVPGAKVATRQTETNVTGTATTDREGRFRFPYLRVGPYDVIVQLQGFATLTRQVTLTIGAAFDLPVTLNVATLETA